MTVCITVTILGQMSLNTCKTVLPLSILLLVLMYFLAPLDNYCPVWGINRFFSVVLGFVFLTVAAMFISYMNRSIFIVSSDRTTLSYIFVLTSLANGGSLFFSKYHIVAVLTLLAISFILKIYVNEELSKNDYFVWCLIVSCASCLIPQIIWVLVPGLVSCLQVAGNNKLKLFLITIGAIAVPAIYIAAYQFLFSDNIWYLPLRDWLTGTVKFSSPRVYSLVQIFHFTVMGIVFLFVVFSVTARAEQIRNTTLRKQSRFIFPYLLFVTIIILTCVRQDDGPGIMIFAIPWSLLFLYSGELTSYGKVWRQMILLTIVSTIILRVYEII